MVFNLDIKHCIFKKGQEVSKEEIEMEIERLTELRTIQSNKNLSYKKILNSTYGVFGFTKFILYNRDVAESITIQSSHVIRWTIRWFNTYFRKRWHTLTEIHKALGITKVKQIDFDVINYADTDSVFVMFGKVIDTTDYKGTLENFIFTLNEMDINDALKVMLHQYIEIYNGFQTKLDHSPSMDLTFEQVSWNILWTSKKKYVKNVCWSDGNSFENMSQIEVKGLEINKSSSPKFIRDKLRETVYYILEMGDKIEISKLITFIKSVRDQFDIASIENISISQRVNGYEKYVIKAENDEFQYVKGIPIGVRACSVYNNELGKSNVKSKYSRIKSGTKIQYYFSSDPRSDVFAFVNGDPCPEIMFECDKVKQFDALFLSPLNKIITAIGLEPLTPSLISFQPLW